ncbi:MAG: hypothetical protein JXB15_11860 [Anaerolineales bacterium]|nr:hypothetical protein [Anaerolineales bacterium]
MMNSRQRFLATMLGGAPDRIPLLEEGLREEVLNAWQEQGLPPQADLQEMFHFDRREEIAPDFYSALPATKLFSMPGGLELLNQRLNPDDPKRLPKGWKRKLNAWQNREHILILQVHHGFFLTLGIEDGRSFTQTMYLMADQPEFVRQVMAIQGEFAVRMAEKILSQVEVDAVLFSEPIAGPHGPLISPRAYQDFVISSYQPVLEVVKRFGIATIIYRTYANAGTLLPVILQSGFNCLWACETNPVQIRGAAAMDYRQIRQTFGSDLHLIGGIDLDMLRLGKDAIRREMEDKLPPLLEQGGYLPLADGRVRQDIPWANYCYYRQLLEELTQP